MKKWGVFCKEHNIQEPYNASYEQGLQFLAHLFEEGNNYGSIAVARSALSAILPRKGDFTFGKDKIVSQLLKGIFKLRPSLPKYTSTYDPDIILDYINELPANNQLNLELLTKKLVTLLALLSGQRCQSISYLETQQSALINGVYCFYIPKVLKTTKPGHHLHALEFHQYVPNANICVVTCIKEYVSRTELIRENNGAQTLILSYAYPHKAVGSATVARYIKDFLNAAGIDLKTFSAHSTRSASTSKAKKIGMSILDINKAAGWKGTSTFRKHYDLPMHNRYDNELQKSYMGNKH